MRSFIILATFLVACTKGASSPDGGGGSGDRTLKFDANGTAIDETLLATATVVSNELGIMGSDNAGHQLAIALATDIGGSYMVGGSVVMTMQYSDGASTWMASASNTPTGSASMNVTTFTSSEIIGTFQGMLAPQGSATGTEMITSGTFDIVVN
jgi:hypothetical protein